MDEFIASLIFLLPGVLTYFWLQSFGVTPPTKHTTTEMTGITVLLWVPTSIFTIAIFDILYFFGDMILKVLNVSINIKFISTLKSLVDQSPNIIFLLLFIVLSIGSSCLVAYLWSIFVYPWVLKSIINCVRSKRDIADLGKNTTVWDEFFIQFSESKKLVEAKEFIESNKDIKSNVNIKTNKDESSVDTLEKSEEYFKANQLAQVVEVYKIGDQEKSSIFGSVKNSARPFEIDRAIILNEVDEWTEYLKNNRPSILKTYIDVKSGIIVNEFDQLDIEKKERERIENKKEKNV